MHVWVHRLLQWVTFITQSLTKFLMTTVGVQRSKEEARRNSRWAEERAVHCRTPITEK